MKVSGNKCLNGCAVQAWTIRTYLLTGCLAVPQIVIGAMVYAFYMLHIGKIIEEELNRQERSVTWFAKKLFCDRTNVYKIFKRQNIDAELLIRISCILKHDFFRYYSDYYERKQNVDD